MTRRGTGFELDLRITQLGSHSGDTQATEPTTVAIRDGLGDRSFGTGFDRLVLTLCFRQEGRPSRPFTLKNAAHYRRYLATLPKVTVRPTARRIEITAATRLPEEEFLPEREASVRRFEALSAELVRILEAARTRLSKARDFEFDAFLAAVELALARVPRAPAGFAARIKELRARDRDRAARRAEADPWADLDLDWSEYHPDGRTLLDDPFFWDPSDDNSPVGNDTGADVLERYRSWRRRRRRLITSPVDYMEKLLVEWGMHEGADESELVRDEAFIALAFAQAMLDGELGEDTWIRGMAAIDRQLDRTRTGADAAERQPALERLRAKLLEIRPSRRTKPQRRPHLRR